MILYLIAGGIIFLFPILVVVALVDISSLKRKIRNLESKSGQTSPVVNQNMLTNLANRVQMIESKLGYVTQQVNQAVENADATQVAQHTEDNAHRQREEAEKLYQLSKIKKGPSSFGKVILWLREEWLMKLGSLLMLFGFGWFVNTNNFLGPLGSITFGIIIGALVMLLGNWRIKTEIHQGSVFLVLGSTVVLLTIYAARNLHELFDPYTALFVTLLSTVFVAFVSVRKKMMGLAVASLLLAAIAPLLVGSSGASYVGLFSYLTIIILGVVWVVSVTGWRSLTLLSLIMTVFHSLPVLSSSVSTRSDILIFAYILGSIFYIFNTVGLLRVRDKKTTSDVTTAALTGAFLLVWILEAAQKEWQVMIILTWMLVFLFGAYFIFIRTGQKKALYIYTGVGISMLAAATTLQLDGPVMTIAYTIESAVISLIMFGALRDYIVGQKYSLLLLGPVLFAMDDISRYASSSTVFNKYFFSILILAISLLVLGLAYRYFETGIKKIGFFANLYIGQVILATFYFYLLLWEGLHNGMKNGDSATMVAIVIYTIIGLATNIYGKVSDRKVYFFYGGTMLILVVARLLFVDFAEMDNTRRIITFFFIGFLLIGAAFMSKGKKKINNITN